MYSLTNYYRRRGLVAQQEATQTLNEQIRNVFQEAARGWFELADISDHLDRREADKRWHPPNINNSEEYRRLAEKVRKAARTVAEGLQFHVDRENLPPKAIGLVRTAQKALARAADVVEGSAKVEEIRIRRAPPHT